jgi:hypothetical protein
VAGKMSQSLSPEKEKAARRREVKLAAALRSNLRRRKKSARSNADATPPDDAQMPVHANDASIR